MDPKETYTNEEVSAGLASGKVTQAQVNEYVAARTALLQEQEKEALRVAKIAEKKESRMAQSTPPPAAAPVPAPAAVAAAVKAEVKMEEAKQLVVRKRPNALYQTDRDRPAFAGDKQALVQGYKDASLCNTLVRDALQRAYMAIEILDDTHANIIRSRLAKAGIKNANSSKGGFTEITFKKATSIALQAEQWVYEAQAAAAKSMVKESNRCRHALVGKRRRTVAEKEAAYKERYGVPRGTKAERAIRKLQEKITTIKEYERKPKKVKKSL